MRESLLQGIWASGRFNGLCLETTQGISIHIVDQGMQNSNSGPDFFNCTIEIEGLRLTGNAEVHLRSSDWERHGHSSEPSYKNVILHIVSVDDIPVPGIHTIEIGKYIEDLEEVTEMAAGDCISEAISSGQFRQRMEELVLKRVERKAGEVIANLKACGYSWHECLYIHLCRSMGLQVNAIPFEWLARSTPFSKLRRHCDQGINNIEAMLFGQSGLLQNATNGSSYERDLWLRYERFVFKYHFRPINALSWKFMRMRPVNFPTIRISQLAAILAAKESSILGLALDVPGEIKNHQIASAAASPFWNYHYTFKKNSAHSIKRLGKAATRSLLINCFVPFRHAFQMRAGAGNQHASSLSLLAQISPEENHYTRLWKKAGFVAESAMATQAILEFHTDHLKNKLSKFAVT